MDNPFIDTFFSLELSCQKKRLQALVNSLAIAHIAVQEWEADYNRATNDVINLMDEVILLKQRLNKGDENEAV